MLIPVPHEVKFAEICPEVVRHLESQGYTVAVPCGGSLDNGTDHSGVRAWLPATPLAGDPPATALPCAFPLQPSTCSAVIDIDDITEEQNNVYYGNLYYHVMLPNDGKHRARFAQLEREHTELVASAAKRVAGSRATAAASPAGSGRSVQVARAAPAEVVAAFRLERLAVPNWTGDGGASLLEALSDATVSRSSQWGKAAVVGASDINAMLGFERQRDLLGCTDDIACVAEIGGALGVDAILVGKLAKLGETFQVSLTVIDIGGARPLVRGAGRVRGDAAQLLELVDELTPKVLGELGRK